MTKTLTALGLIAFAGSAALAGDIVKPPDQGAFWQPLGPNGSYVYADSFVADETGPVDDIGTWLLSLNGAGAGSNLTFMVLGDAGGPNPNDVIASTGSLNLGGGTNTLDFYSAAPTFSGVLTSGNTYWFAASAVGEDPNTGSWQVGAHTQNSVYNDNGTFWFSNDPAGQNFDGQGFTPEMAFSVSIVPAPGAFALLGLGGLAATRRRR